MPREVDDPLQRRRGGETWPVWLGLATLVVVSALWATVEAPPDEAAADAAVATLDDAGPPTPSRWMTWRVEGRDAPTAAALDACLAEQTWGDAIVADAPGGGLTVAYPGLPFPQRLRAAEGDLTLATATDGDPHRAAGLHLASLACLAANAAAAVDVDLDRRFGPEDWPRPGARGGLPVDKLVAIEARDGVLVTRGLSRLGRQELGLRAADEPAARQTLAHAAARRVAYGDTPVLRLPVVGTARAVPVEAARAAGLWPADGPAVDVLTNEAGDAPLALRPAAPDATPPRRRRPPPEAAAPPPRRDPAPPRPRREARPKQPAFRPDYR